jgi:hypothetical protein
VCESVWECEECEECVRVCGSVCGVCVECVWSVGGVWVGVGRLGPFFENLSIAL